MKKISYESFAKIFYKRLTARIPFHGQIELTYRCAFSCPHCYLKPYQSKPDEGKELSFADWSIILDNLHRENCLTLTFTGGDPLLRKDFFDIYSYARRKGFIITVFTNPTSLTEETLAFFKKQRPFSIEITLNSLKEERFDILTGTRGNFKSAMANINMAVELKLPVILKTNGMTINKDEVISIKDFAKGLLGKKRYKLDTYIMPCVDGDRTPLRYRLSPADICALEESDYEVREAVIASYKENLDIPLIKDKPYRCNSWHSSFFIDPHGILKFCHISNKFSTDLKTDSFKRGFYERFPEIGEKEYEKDSKCRRCPLISECMSCPARAFLETGDEEAPVSYFCQLAAMKSKQKNALINDSGKKI